MGEREETAKVEFTSGSGKLTHSTASEEYLMSCMFICMKGPATFYIPVKWRSRWSLNPMFCSRALCVFMHVQVKERKVLSGLLLDT